VVDDGDDDVHVKGHWNAGRWIHPHWRRRPKKRGANNSGQGGNKGLAIALSATGIAATVTIGGVSIKLNTSSDAPSSEKDVSPEARAGFKHAEATLTADGFKATTAKVEFGSNCAAHSYGQVKKFFRSNPCKSLGRAYIRIGEPDQGLILIAVSWVGMPDSSSAEDYKKLVDTPGSGNVTELSREEKLYKNINYTNSAHTSGVHGAAVWNVQVNPVFPATPDVVTRILIDSRQ
jgi:hypothetical protein